MTKKSPEMVYRCEKIGDTFGMVAVPRNSETTTHTCKKCGFTWKAINKDPLMCPSCKNSAT